MSELLSTDPTTGKRGTRRCRDGRKSALALSCPDRALSVLSVIFPVLSPAARKQGLAYVRRCGRFLFLVLLFSSLTCGAGVTATADPSDGLTPAWEPLLWGGRIMLPRDEGSGPQPSSPDRQDRVTDHEAASPAPAPEQDQQAPSAPAERYPQPDRSSRAPEETKALSIAPYRGSVLAVSYPEIHRAHVQEPFQRLLMKNIPPLYVTPRLPGEGVWEWKGMPGGEHGGPALYRTTYRPSASHPNAIVHMILFDMNRVSMRLYVGSSEPGASRAASRIEPENRSLLLAITNGLWKQKHSLGGGAVFRGEVLQKLAPGMATLVAYNDDSVDVLEWNEGIPASIVRDARQLRHLIVKDGKVVESIIQSGQKVDSEIGLGYLLSEDQQSPYPDVWGGWFQMGSRVNYSPDWFIATRSAFGIRRDGNLVFAIGHHISTKDLAKALVLAGCERAIHGDANPHNVLGNLYYTREDGTITNTAKLSPDQREDTLRRYVDRMYTSDFFAFFRKSGRKDPS